MRLADPAPLTARQARLVSQYFEWARAGARKRAPQYSRWATVDELESAACLGLMAAARKFDPARGLSFKTLAMRYTEGFMSREVDTRRRLEGAVFDYRVDGHMRAVRVRVDWPETDEGRPLDLVSVGPLQHEALEREDLRAFVLRRAGRERRIARLMLEGLNQKEIAARVRRPATVIRQRVAALTRRLQRELETAC